MGVSRPTLESMPIESSHSLLTHHEATAGLRSLRPGVLDFSPGLLKESFAVRFRVYCQELGFLPMADYPDGLERDEYDGTAIHVGAVDEFGTLHGTARIVLPGPDGHLPALDHCSVFPEQRSSLWAAPHRLMEVSRMCVRPPARHVDDIRPARRYPVGKVFDTVLLAAYLVSRRLGATHWLGATEVPLHRLLLKRGYPFRQIGPVGDYYGPVAIYAMDLAEPCHPFVRDGLQFAADRLLDNGAA